MGNFPSNFPISLRTPRAFPHASPSNRRPVRPFGRGAWFFCATAAYKHTTTRSLYSAPHGGMQQPAQSCKTTRRLYPASHGGMQQPVQKPRNNAPGTPQYLLPHAKSPVNPPTPCKFFSIFSVATTTSSYSSCSKS